MSFVRQTSDSWHHGSRGVPGARWFKADLHVHTIDDHPGGRAKLPPGCASLPSDPETLRQYARVFLEGVVKSGVEVLGLTPHSPRMGDPQGLSAVWQIVETWNSESDGDGVPFREKIYAVFPGFEPNLKEGKEGLHLLFLFDPEVGRDLYLKAFDVLMVGASPWSGNSLNISSRTAPEAFADLKTLRERAARPDTKGTRPWNMLVLAPHVESSKGLFHAEKAQVLQHFQHDELAGLELPDNKLPHDLHGEKGAWLAEGMARYRHAFYHASDAYKISATDAPAEHEIGYRCTWIKMASPRIEALRQAFVASDSRLRIAYERNSEGRLQPKASPHADATGRPWLRSVIIRGGASFFGGSRQGTAAESRFELNQDLTCVIGGSMTGKSTFLDGLRWRLYCDQPDKLPKEPELRRLVEARAQLLHGGAPSIELETPGRASTASEVDRWPAVFFTQNELQRLGRDPAAVEEIVGRLSPQEQAGILGRAAELAALDRTLEGAADSLARLLDDHAQAEQQLQRAKEAKAALEAFRAAGIDEQRLAQAAAERWRSIGGDLTTAGGQMEKLEATLRELGLPAADEMLKKAWAAARADAIPDVHAQLDEVRRSLVETRRALESLVGSANAISKAVAAYAAVVQQAVERRLAGLGQTALKLREIQELAKQAALLDSVDAALAEVKRRQAEETARFEIALRRRDQCTAEQRAAYDRVAGWVQRDFADRIRIRRDDHAVTEKLEAYLVALAKKGITQWWNSRKAQRPAPAPGELLLRLRENSLRDLGMSDAVAATFREAMTPARQWKLAAVRSPDRYVLELRLDDSSYRLIDDLSGGQRVSVLLSMLLEATDTRPLVIDQPEDELDNRFLWETVLPALRRLKGRRQVIVATHNANIVVNGDADQVIQLEATANQGSIANSGAIEDPAVREAILKTVDGGREAFQLRLVKYGF